MYYVVGVVVIVVVVVVVVYCKMSFRIVHLMDKQLTQTIKYN